MYAKLLLRLCTTSVAACLFGAAGWVAISPVDGASDDLAAPPAARALPAWIPPAWHPASTALWALEQMGSEGPDEPPRLRSSSAYVFDVDRGEVLLDHNADNIQPVASLTKLVSALAMVSTRYDLDREICIGAEHYPSRSGARSKLSTGDCIQGWDALGAALVASDNRGAYALASATDLDQDGFITRMNEVSAELGMDMSSWTDPSGLEDENLSTARDLARATLAVAEHPVLSSVSSAPSWDLHYDHRPTRRRYTTNKLSGRRDLQIEAAKTGYTDTAGYCYSTALTTRDGRRVVVTLLGAHRDRDRYRDLSALLRWIDGLEV
jgi:D-alanyl-D-alanine endopeptidase (penicillin-binding protein 7)